MAPTVYTMEISAPARSVLLVAKAIELEVDEVVLDPMKGEHLTPDFVQINPEHTVPTLVDDGYILWDSHAISAYLVDKYAKDDSLYPKDLKKRAAVNQRLFFDCGVLQPRLGAILGPIVRQGAKTVPKDKVDNLIQAYTILEEALEKNPFVAGETLTIADLAVAMTVIACAAFAPIAENRFPKLTAWLSRLDEIPYFKEVNQPRADKFKAFIKSKVL